MQISHLLKSFSWYSSDATTLKNMKKVVTFPLYSFMSIGHNLVIFQQIFLKALYLSLRLIFFSFFCQWWREDLIFIRVLWITSMKFEKTGKVFFVAKKLKINFHTMPWTIIRGTQKNSFSQLSLGHMLLNNP